MYQRRWMWIVLSAAVLATAGCRGEGDVKQEVKDLEQAEKQSPEVAQDLRQELEAKKVEVAKLEEKLALAEQGVTDRVVQERRELQDAVRRQEQNVQREVKEAQGAAQVHNVDAERARRELEETKTPGRVEATVKTERKMVPAPETTVEVQKQQQQVPIETTKTVERRTEVQNQPAPQPGPAPAH